VKAMQAMCLSIIARAKLQHRWKQIGEKIQFRTLVVKSGFRQSQMTSVRRSSAQQLDVPWTWW